MVWVLASAQCSNSEEAKVLKQSGYNLHPVGKTTGEYITYVMCVKLFLEPLRLICLSVNGVISACPDNPIRCFWNIYFCFVKTSRLHPCDCSCSKTDTLNNTLLEFDLKTSYVKHFLLSPCLYNSISKPLCVAIISCTHSIY